VCVYLFGAPLCPLGLKGGLGSTLRRVGGGGGGGGWVVFIPGDAPHPPLPLGSRQHVDVSVSVHVDGEHRDGKSCRADGVLCEHLLVVLVPGDAALQGRNNV